MVRQARHGERRLGLESVGAAGKARHVVVRLCTVWTGMVWQAWSVVFRRVRLRFALVRLGRHGTVPQGLDRCGGFWQVKAGVAL